MLCSSIGTEWVAMQMAKVQDANNAWCGYKAISKGSKKNNPYTLLFSFPLHFQKVGVSLNIKRSLFGHRFCLI